MNIDNELEYLKKEKWSNIRLELDNNTICAKSNTKTALFLLKSLQIKIDSLLELPYNFDLQYNTDIILGDLISLMQRKNITTTKFLALSVKKIKHQNKIWYGFILKYSFSSFPVRFAPDEEDPMIGIMVFPRNTNGNCYLDIFYSIRGHVDKQKYSIAAGGTTVFYCFSLENGIVEIMSTQHNPPELYSADDCIYQFKDNIEIHSLFYEKTTSLFPSARFASLICCGLFGAGWSNFLLCGLYDPRLLEPIAQFAGMVAFDNSRSLKQNRY